MDRQNVHRDYQGLELRNARLGTTAPTVAPGLETDHVLWFDEDTIAFAHNGQPRRVTLETAPQAVTLAYTEDGNVNTVTTTDGNVTTLAYTEDGNVNTVTTSDYIIALTYTEDGNVATITPQELTP